MNFIDKIIGICTVSADKIEPKSKIFLKSILLSYFSIVSIAILVTFSIIAFLNSHILLSVIFLSISILVLINFITLRSTGNYTRASILFITIISVLALWLIYNGVTGKQGILLFSIFPALLILLLDQKKGSIASLIIFILIVIPLFFFETLNLPARYTLNNNLLFVFLYLGFYFFMNMYELLRVNLITVYEAELKQAETEIQSKEEFISKISHQIRTPLNNIVVITNMLTDSNIDEKQRDLIDTIQASTNNMVNVVNNISELSNVDVLQSKDYNQNFNLSSTLKNTINLFSNEESNDIFFPLVINDELKYQLYGDPVKLKQIFLNLIENILKNSKSGKKTINLNVNKSAEYNDSVDISFGVSTKDFVHIPEALRIQGIEKNKKLRNGAFIKLLDLNIANRIIESLGGTIDIEFSSDRFDFQFIIKFKKGDTIKEEIKEKEEFAEAYALSEEKINLKDANILLVEDNLINQKIVLLSLKKSVKNIDIANNGKEALDKFGLVKYDIILMDIQMPIMNGIITTKKIRSIEKSTNTHTPIIAITANALLGDKEECLAAGMDDYISKPFQIDTLIKKMDQQLNIVRI
ncbi:MAG: hypothetical protein A2041_08900 [Bacteroidetes bacterium GWA2_31_9b]|nr:MAG: hypothetical protein A2041_08900 [Bacteroidetes bacterium GWA2_31_9b]